MRTVRRSIPAAILILIGTVATLADGPGWIEGRVTRGDGSPVAGVGVAIEGTSTVTVTGNEGRFELQRVRPGNYALTFTLLDNSAQRSDVVVTSGEATTVDLVVDWKLSIFDTLTVRSASRRRERIVEAPSAVTTVGEEAIEREALHGQIPKLIEFTPGVGITQGDVLDFNLNTRGFNSSLSRRVPLLVDGRETMDPFGGAPEWATLSFPLDDVAELELLRGPSSALYGANATSGLMSLTTKQPRYSPGGQVRLTAGGLDTWNTDFRWAGGLGAGWYLKAVASTRRMENFAVSRLNSVEYSVPCDPAADPPIVTDCLPKDAIPFEKDEIRSDYGGLRVDKYFGEGSVLTLEGGLMNYEGTLFVNTGGTRGQILDTDRPWARFNFTSNHWNVLAYYNDRESESRNLTTGASFALEADNYRVQAQTNWDFAGDRVRLVAGGLYGEENIETAALRQSVDSHEKALFAQADWRIRDDLKLVGALRWDDHWLYDSQLSPKGSVVWDVGPTHTVRFTYNEGFQEPVYVEYLLYFPIAAFPTGGLEAICTDAGVSCGLDGEAPVLILGNEDLEVEETTTFEIGYRGVVGQKTFISLEVYESKNEQFVTPFVPQLGTPLGRVNDNFGPWVPPPDAGDVPDDVVNDVRDAFADAPLPPGWQLTNLDGDTIVLAMSTTTFGRVDTSGADLGVIYQANERWRVSFGYSWFGWDVKDSVPGLETVLSVNAPRNKAFGGVVYDAGHWDVGLQGRWTDEFRWANGNMRGDVDAYTVFDLSGNYEIGSHWKVGVHVANLFDDDHWESFGSSLLERRALGHVTFFW